MRRATTPLQSLAWLPVISIHALHEESDVQEVAEHLDQLRISIHALHEESDIKPDTPHSVRPEISIHALHEESDRLGRIG